MDQKTILTIILNYKTADMTLKAAAAAVAEMSDVQGKILIVDNDSQDGSFEALVAGVKDYGWSADRVEVLQSGENGGFGAGNNFGIRHGLRNGIGGRAPDYIYIQNSDAFPHDGAIAALFDHLETHPKTGMAGSYIHGPDGAPHLTAFRFPSVASELEGAAKFGPISRLLKHAIVPLPIPETTQQVDWAAGASVMIRREVLEEIGLFDETFFLYFEETDLCLRAQRAGWALDYVRASEVEHIGSVSTGMKTWERIPTFWLDSRLHYFVSNHGAGYAALATFAHLMGGSIAQLRALLQGKSTGQPKYFLIDMANHALKAVLTGKVRRPRNVIFPNGDRPLKGA
ncbi:MAG: glycosyltransferase family 2 protein [Cognatishimia sp.]|uniref:glycosyltransferase family 2 protein n=1 Tax=Cognatishimia sp. TaxID=2211648 RepID=UPI003B8CE05F